MTAPQAYAVHSDRAEPMTTIARSSCDAAIAAIEAGAQRVEVSNLPDVFKAALRPFAPKEGRRIAGDLAEPSAAEKSRRQDTQAFRPQQQQNDIQNWINRDRP
jgi:hypothetical protein